jgi:hypothetical protein
MAHHAIPQNRAGAQEIPDVLRKALRSAHRVSPTYLEHHAAVPLTPASRDAYAGNPYADRVGPIVQRRVLTEKANPFA